MNKTTKIFLLFISFAFVIVTLLIMFGGYSYQLKGNNTSQKVQNNPKVQNSSSGNVDMSAYSDAMHEKIVSKWTPPSTDKDARVVLEFTIQKNGHVVNAKIDQSSGNKDIDNSAMTALRKASPLPPLPLNLPQNSMNVKFDFVVKGRE